MNPSSRSKKITWLGPGIVAIAFVTLAALTWRKWPDVLVDFGTQLYLPWKISQGAVLYKDINYLPGGPFSQYFNAALFKFFGVSLLTLVITNLLIAAALIALIYRKFLQSADAWTATLVSLSIVLAFAFAQYSDIGNYNYITPYSHEIWHGLALSILAIALLSSWLKNEKILFAAGAGFCAGLVFMTKPDVFIALAVGALTSFILTIAAKRSANLLAKSLAAFLFAAMIPLLVFLFYFRLHEGWRDSLRSICFAWVPLMKSGVFQNPYYNWGMGLDAPWLHVRKMFAHFGVVCVFVMVSAMIFRRNLSRPANRILAFAWIGVMIAWASSFDWVECGRSLPLLDGILCLLLFAQFRREKTPASTFPLPWAVFGLVLLSKLGFYGRIWHYGFALAMPAFVSAIFLLYWLLPSRLEKFQVNSSWFRITVALVLLTGLTKLFLVSQFEYHNKTVAVGSNGDTIFAPNEKISPVGAAMQSALAWLDKNAPPNATLAVLPEGVMLNYLSRRNNPAHYPVWVLPELAAFGQANMTADFENHPPDYIVLIHRDASEYGLKYFGQDERFGLELMRWIQKNYETADLIGKEPLVNSSFGIKILKRTSPQK